MIGFISYLWVNDDVHKNLNEFEVRRDPTMDYEVGCPWASEKKIPQTYNGENDVITGNDDIHKSLDEFEIRPDSTTDHRASCP